MKKITVILSVLFLALGVQTFAQETTPRNNDVDQVQPFQGEREMRQGRDGERMRAPRANRRKTAREAKRMRKAHRRHLRSLRSVARADGRVSPGERRAIKRQSKKFRRGAKPSIRRNHMRRHNRGFQQ